MNTLSEPTAPNALDKKILPHHVGLTLSAVVRELAPVIGDPINTPSMVYALCAPLSRKKQEALVALYLDSQNRLIARRTISVGALNTTRSHPREILYPATRHRAMGFILVHNHPSGTLTPSSDDIDFTTGSAARPRCSGSRCTTT